MISRQPTTVGDGPSRVLPLRRGNHVPTGAALGRSWKDLSAIRPIAPPDDRSLCEVRRLHPTRHKPPSPLVSHVRGAAWTATGPRFHRILRSNRRLTVPGT